MRRPAIANHALPFAAVLTASLLATTPAYASEMVIAGVVTVVMPGALVGTLVLGLLCGVDHRSGWHAPACAAAILITAMGLLVTIPFVAYAFRANVGFGVLYLAEVLTFASVGWWSVRTLMTTNRDEGP